MLKKVIHIVVSILLLTSTMGLTLSAHYCGENLKSISVLADPASCCDIPDGCCHDEAETYRVEDDYAASSFQFDSKQIINLIQEYSIALVIDLSDKNYSVPSYIEPPPPTIKQVLSSLQVYIL
jgi:hypothetical protein